MPWKLTVKFEGVVGFFFRADRRTTAVLVDGRQPSGGIKEHIPRLVIGSKSVELRNQAVEILDGNEPTNEANGKRHRFGFVGYPIFTDVDSTLTIANLKDGVLEGNLAEVCVARVNLIGGMLRTSEGAEHLWNFIKEGTGAIVSGPHVLMTSVLWEYTMQQPMARIVVHPDKNGNHGETYDVVPDGDEATIKIMNEEDDEMLPIGGIKNRSLDFKLVYKLFKGTHDPCVLEETFRHPKDTQVEPRKLYEQLRESGVSRDLALVVLKTRQIPCIGGGVG